MRKFGRLLRSASLLLVFAATAAFAQLKEGRDFVPIAAQPGEVAGRIEVTEFFWYGCPHCFDFEPVINAWLKRMPVDIAFRRIPAIFPNGRWAPGARLFYALEAIGEEQRVRGDLFDAIHIQNLEYVNEAEVTDWLARHGVDRQKFSAAYNSPAVQAKVNRAQDLTQAHAIGGVPTMVVGGRYKTSNTMLGSHEAVPAAIDELIARVRAEQARAK